MLLLFFFVALFLLALVHLSEGIRSLFVLVVPERETHCLLISQQSIGHVLPMESLHLEFNAH